MSFKILDMYNVTFCSTSNPCVERLLAREGLNILALCFLVNAFAQLKVKRGKWKIISCHSEDEIRRISISWETNANPCDSSLRSERQVLCHTALDAVSQELSFSSITFPSSSTEGRRSSLLKSNRLDSQPFRLRMTERTHCHCEPRSGVAIQYPKHLDCFVVLRTPRNDGKNHSTLQLFNSRESSPHPSLCLDRFALNVSTVFCIKELHSFRKKLPHFAHLSLLKERENPVTNLTPLSQCKTWRTLPC